MVFNFFSKPDLSVKRTKAHYGSNHKYPRMQITIRPSAESQVRCRISTTEILFYLCSVITWPQEKQTRILSLVDQTNFNPLFNFEYTDYFITDIVNINSKKHQCNV